MYKYRCITQTTTWIQCLGPFTSASKSLSSVLQRLCCVNISDAISWHSKTQLKIGTGNMTYSSCPLYHFTLMFKSSQYSCITYGHNCLEWIQKKNAVSNKHCRNLNQALGNFYLFIQLLNFVLLLHQQSTSLSFFNKDDNIRKYILSFNLFARNYIIVPLFSIILQSIDKKTNFISIWFECLSVQRFSHLLFDVVPFILWNLKLPYKFTISCNIYLNTNLI